MHDIDTQLSQQWRIVLLSSQHRPTHLYRFPRSTTCSYLCRVKKRTTKRFENLAAYGASSTMAIYGYVGICEWLSPPNQSEPIVTSLLRCDPRPITSIHLSPCVYRSQHCAVKPQHVAHRTLIANLSTTLYPLHISR